ncbi:MAG: hypothetical protein P4L49_01260 [Desulfosporosinus sp.]|nr:hypothetical protein [Desulfosporosinus sp.]
MPYVGIVKAFDFIHATNEVLEHAQISSTLIYANADTEMKKEAIMKATSKLNPLQSVLR